MPPEIVALIDKPWLLALVLAIGAACGIAVERVSEQMNRAERRARWQRRQGKRWNEKAVLRSMSVDGQRPTLPTNCAS